MHYYMVPQKKVKLVGRKILCQLVATNFLLTIFVVTLRLGSMCAHTCAFTPLSQDRRVGINGFYHVIWVTYCKLIKTTFKVVKCLLLKYFSLFGLILRFCVINDSPKIGYVSSHKIWTQNPISMYLPNLVAFDRSHRDVSDKMVSRPFVAINFVQKPRSWQKAKVQWKQKLNILYLNQVQWNTKLSMKHKILFLISITIKNDK